MMIKWPDDSTGVRKAGTENRTGHREKPERLKSV